MDSGLTKQQKDVIRASWGQFSSNAVTHGIGFYNSLFKAYPDMFKAFKDLFKDASVHQLDNNPKMKAQSRVFSDAIGSYVDNLDNQEVLIVLVQKMTKLHFSKGLRMKTFNDAYGVFVRYLQDSFHIDAATKEAWEKLTAFICRIMDDQMKQLS